MLPLASLIKYCAGVSCIVRAISPLAVILASFNALLTSAISLLASTSLTTANPVKLVGLNTNSKVLPELKPLPCIFCLALSLANLFSFLLRTSFRVLSSLLNSSLAAFSSVVRFILALSTSSAFLISPLLASLEATLATSALAITGVFSIVSHPITLSSAIESKSITLSSIASKLGVSSFIISKLISSVSIPSKLGSSLTSSIASNSASLISFSSTFLTFSTLSFLGPIFSTLEESTTGVGIPLLTFPSFNSFSLFSTALVILSLSVLSKVVLFTSLSLTFSSLPASIVGILSSNFLRVLILSISSFINLIADSWYLLNVGWSASTLVTYDSSFPDLIACLIQVFVFSVISLPSTTSDLISSTLALSTTGAATGSISVVTSLTGSATTPFTKSP